MEQTNFLTFWRGGKMKTKVADNVPQLTEVAACKNF